MEDDKKYVPKKQCARKLNCPFAVKLLQENFNTHTNTGGVPFSWEGVPSDTGITYQTPPTPPPSSRWQQSAIGGACTDVQIADHLPNCALDGFGGREAIGIFSLAETTEGFAENGKTCSTEEPDAANQSPDFIIQNFLPDAQALAAASPAQKKLLLSSLPSSRASFSRPVGGGCGFRSLYHLLVKPKGKTPPGVGKSHRTSDSSNIQEKC